MKNGITSALFCYALTLALAAFTGIGLAGAGHLSLTPAQEYLRLSSQLCVLSYLSLVLCLETLLLAFHFRFTTWTRQLFAGAALYALPPAIYATVISPFGASFNRFEALDKSLWLVVAANLATVLVWSAVAKLFKKARHPRADYLTLANFFLMALLGLLSLNAFFSSSLWLWASLPISGIYAAGCWNLQALESSKKS